MEIIVYGQMPKLHHGTNSTYIRTGAKGELIKIGHYCSECDLHYNIDEKLYTVFRDSQIIEPADKIQDNEYITTISRLHFFLCHFHGRTSYVYWEFLQMIITLQFF